MPRFTPVLTLALLLLSGTATATSAQTGPTGPERWEATIANFEAADRESPPPADVIVFTGSSSIRFWGTLEEDFPTINVLNRGFGGSRISDIRHFSDRLILAYRPRIAVVYAGDNDIGAGRSADDVFEDYRAIAQLVRESLPETRLVFIAIKPSPRRWANAPAMREANAKISAYAETDPMLDFVDVFEPMLGGDGLPRPELYVEDQLHLSEEGYRLWRELVAPYVER